MRPTGSVVNGSVLMHVNFDSGTAAQFFIEFGTSATWARAKNGTWSGWRRTNQTALIAKSASYQAANEDFGATVRFSGGTTANYTLVPNIGYDGGLIQVINRNSGNLAIVDSGITLTWLLGAQRPQAQGHCGQALSARLSASAQQCTKFQEWACYEPTAFFCQGQYI